MAQTAGTVEAEGTAGSPVSGAAPDDGATGVLLYLSETVRPGFDYTIEARPVSRTQSAYQLVEVLHTPAFGTVLRIDGAMQCSERDEAFYHEPLVHGVLLRAARRGRVLIVGGGDGGAAEEALKWPDLHELTQVEIDAEVVRACIGPLRAVHGGLLDDGLLPDGGRRGRFRLHFADGAAHVRALAARGERLDALILDLTDPGGASGSLWTEAFFADCARALADDGVLGLHVGAPWAQAARCAQVLDALRASFAHVEPVVVSVPLSGGQWLMAFASRAAGALPAPARIDAMLATLHGAPLQVVDGAWLHAATVLPVAWRQVLG